VAGKTATLDAVERLLLALVLRPDHPGQVVHGWRTSKQTAHVGTRGFHPHFHIVDDDTSLPLKRHVRKTAGSVVPWHVLPGASRRSPRRRAVGRMKIRSPCRTQRLTGPDTSGTPALTASFFMVVPSVSALRRRGIPPRRLVTVDAQRMAAAMRMQESRRSRQTIDTISCWHGGQGGDPSRRAQQEEIFDVRL
jgi:hypothetical protein